MLNVPFHALAYVLTPKYYHPSWLSTPAPGGGSRRKPHQDQEVHKKYMIALSKLVPDEEEATMVQRQLTNYMLNIGPFGSMHTIRNRETFSSRVVEHAWRGYSTSTDFGIAGAITGGKHFFCREVLELLFFHPQCYKEQVEFRLGREFGVCSL